ncbi:glycyl-radical enzyme activating protein [bacterium]|nr:glycyl-radical enzyme activating protein [bacterium]
METTGRIFNIARFSLHDGPGIRTVVFLKGCPLACAWCHNPEGMGAAAEAFFRPDRCVGCGRCAAACPRISAGDDAAAGAAAAMAVGAAEMPQAAGTPHVAPFPDGDCPPGCQACAAACPVGAREAVGAPWGVDALLSEALADRAFYESSGGGVTLSGGEPLAQPDFSASFLAACGAAGLHRAVETSGFASEEAFGLVAGQADLLLFDVKLLDPDAHRAWTGADLAPILRNLRSAAAAGIPVIIRRPLIPGVNDGEAEMTVLADLAAGLGLGVDLLPYHGDAEDKYRKRRMPYRLAGAKAPEAEAVARCESMLTGRGVRVRIGG